MKKLAQAGQDLEQLASVPELWDATLQVLAAHQIEFVIYNTVNKEFAQPVTLTNVPEIFAQTDPSKDPFLRYCCDSYAATCTGPSYLPDYEYLPEDAKNFISQASKTGFSTGLGIPMRLQGSSRFGGFNLGTRLDVESFERDVLPYTEDIRFFCLLVHRRLEELTRGTGTAQNSTFRDLLLAPENTALAPLSNRETEVIYLVARGLSRKECARLCSISPNTVAEYTKNAYRKLGVSNRVEAARLVFGRDELES